MRLAPVSDKPLAGTMARLIRWLLYLVVFVGAIPLTMWLAFGSGIALPYVAFTWPGRHILRIVRWSEGSVERMDILGELLLSALLWFLLVFSIDLAFTVRRARRAS